MRVLFVLAGCGLLLGCQQKELDEALKRASAAEHESAQLKARVSELEAQVGVLSATDSATFGRATDAEAAGDLDLAVKLYGEVQKRFPTSSLAAESKQRSDRIASRREAQKKEGLASLAKLDLEIKKAPDATSALALIAAFDTRYPVKELGPLLAERREGLSRAAKVEKDAKDQGLLLFKPGVGVLGRVALCDTSQKVVTEFGRPTKVEEINNVWDGLIDDYQFVREGEEKPWLIFRVRKNVDKVIQIYAGDHWATTEGVRHGENELQMRKVYGRCPEETGILSSSTFNCLSGGRRISFGQGWPKVMVTDEKGLRREVYPLSGVGVSTGGCQPPKAKGGPDDGE